MKEQLVRDLASLMHNKNAWDSNQFNYISKILRDIERVTGEDFYDFHHRLGRLNYRDEKDQRDFEKLMKEIIEALT